MIGREKRENNDLFFTCSLIDYIARITKNHRRVVVNALKNERIAKIYELADVYHSDNIEKVSADFIADADIKTGTFDNVADCDYTIPTHWDIGKVYKRLIIGVAAHKEIDVIDALVEVYNSDISAKIDDYNTSFYYEFSANILLTYLTGEIQN